MNTHWSRRNNQLTYARVFSLDWWSQHREPQANERVSSLIGKEDAKQAQAAQNRFPYKRKEFQSTKRRKDKKEA